MKCWKKTCALLFFQALVAVVVINYHSWGDERSVFKRTNRNFVKEEPYSSGKQLPAYRNGENEKQEFNQHQRHNKQRYDYADKKQNINFVKKESYSSGKELPTFENGANDKQEFNNHQRYNKQTFVFTDKRTNINFVKEKSHSEKQLPAFEKQQEFNKRQRYDKEIYDYADKKKHDNFERDEPHSELRLPAFENRANEKKQEFHKRQGYDKEIYDYADKRTNDNFVKEELHSEKQLSAFEKQQDLNRRQWCRTQKARIDWEGFLRACKNHTVWGQTNFPATKQTSATNSYISKWELYPAASFSRLFIQSVSIVNEKKSIGGDTWRVHIRGPSTVAPTVFDLDDGSYELLFLIMEPGKYEADIWLDYTLCNGLKDPPPFWFKEGNPQGKNQPDGILRGDKPFLIQKFRPHEQIFFDIVNDNSSSEGFSSNVSCACPSLLWNGLGRWVDTAWQPYVKEKLRFRRPTTRQGTLFIFGDSLANHFYGSLTVGPYREICTRAFISCKVVYNWVYLMRGYWGDGITSPREPLPDGKDFDLKRVFDELREELYHPAMDEHSVMVLNWGIHYAAVVSFQTYQTLINDFIHIIKHGETDPKTGIVRKFRGKLIWKTSTAINRHRFPNPHKDVRRFLTFPRILLYNAFATSAMCKAGIDVIDVYPISDAYPNGTVSASDPVHYNREVFGEVERLLFETFRP